MKNTTEEFNKNGYAVLKNFIPKEVAEFLSDYLLVQKEMNKVSGVNSGDAQVPDADSVFKEDPTLESLYLSYTTKVEEALKINLLPTYIYGRIYKTGNVLAPHRDRPSCEISATVKLAESEDYSWPIWIDDSCVELGVGDALLYRGCDLTHWRDKCEANENYYLTQIFVHFVEQDGVYKDYAFDGNQTRHAILSRAKENKSRRSA